MGNRPGQRPTLKDIALKTGYSVNTVSRALRNMPDIAMETREKIREVARSIGYHNNALASSLRLGRTNTIAVIIPDISNLFYAFALVEIERGAREQGYSTILLNTSESGEFEHNAIRTALQKNVDGIIFGPAQQSSENARMLLDSGTPFVLFARHFGDVDADFVVGDDKLGGYQATMHLIEKGHRNIMLLNGLAAQNSSAQGREAGYYAAHEAAGLRVQTALVREVSLLGNDAGQQLMSMLQRRPDITAVFAYSDLVALSAIAYLQEKGVRVPEDISIVGFDHIRAHINLPISLATVDIKIREMATTALECLLDKIEDGDSRKVLCQKFVQTELVPGGTVRDIRT
ncbi:LacI family transcriptional regulator [Ruminococcaceae bacterium OttesenSCG-928-A11]|nr:LacI family transcriptional regulator [Ruminococcaceae bacterium OttesenSCG-928-A11]